MNNIRLTHFFGFSTVPENLHESLLREYADNGATTLSMPNLLLESFLAKPDKAVAFHKLLEKTGISIAGNGVVNGYTLNGTEKKHKVMVTDKAGYTAVREMTLVAE